jgi:GT2 family glycosyltransferase
MPETKVDIQLVAWNGDKFLPACLDSLTRQSFKSWRLLALDNGSTDHTVEILENFLVSSPGSLRRESANRGFARAHNSLFADSQAPYVLILNQDLKLEDNYLNALIDYMERHPKVGSASGLLLRGKLKSGELSPTDTVDALGLKIYKNYRVVEQKRGETWRDAEKLVWPVFGVPATAALYRRGALESVSLGQEIGLVFAGFFDSYKEDVDLAYRLQLKGWDSVCLTNTKAYHERGLAGGPDASSGWGNFNTLNVQLTRSARQVKLSWRNHLYFLKSVPRLVGAGPWLRTWGYELVKFLWLLITKPSVLSAIRDIIVARSLLQEKLKLTVARPVQLSRIKYWMAN